jgi:hypothetical protein
VINFDENVQKSDTMVKRECEGCGCWFHPFQQDGTKDFKCPYCGGGRGTVIQTPVQRIRALERFISSVVYKLEEITEEFWEGIPE